MKKKKVNKQLQMLEALIDRGDSFLPEKPEKGEIPQNKEGQSRTSDAPPTSPSTEYTEKKESLEGDSDSFDVKFATHQS